MAGDRHGKHNTTTISFRVNSYEKATIEERVKVSGMKKQDYIVRSCIYNHVSITISLMPMAFENSSRPRGYMS